MNVVKVWQCLLALAPSFVLGSEGALGGGVTPHMITIYIKEIQIHMTKYHCTLSYTSNIRAQIRAKNLVCLMIGYDPPNNSGGCDI